MATATQQIILEVEVDDSGAVKAVKNVGKEVDKLQDKTEKVGKGGGGLEFLEKISPKAAGAVKGLTSNIGGLAGGFKTLRAAIISTGIGALVVALGSLVAFFTKTKRGAELLERATAALGAAMSVIIDRASMLGEGLVKAFRDPKQAIKDLGDFIVQNLQNRLDGLIGTVLAVNDTFKALARFDFDGVKQGAIDFASATQEAFTGIKTEDIIDFFQDVGEEIANDVKAMDGLTKAAQRLRDAERNLAVETANRRAEIKELNKVAEDTTLTYQERIRAAEQATAIEEELMQRRLAAAAENVRIIREQNALGESTEEDLQRLADAEIELAGIREQSLELQTTLQNKVNTIRQQQKSEELAQEKRLAEEQKKIFAEVEKVREFLANQRAKSEEEKVNERYAKLREQANGETELLKELELNRQAELGAIKLEALKKEEEAAKASAMKQAEDSMKLQEARIGFAKSTASSLVTIAQAFAGDNEANARKIFAVNKALGIATAVADTYRGANAALADPTLVGGARFVAVATAITTGLANVAKIAATKFGGGAPSGGGSRPSIGSNAPQAPQPPAPVNFAFPQGEGQEPIRAYVQGSDIQDEQEARVRTKDLVTL